MNAEREYGDESQRLAELLQESIDTGVNVFGGVTVQNLVLAIQPMQAGAGGNEEPSEVVKPPIDTTSPSDANKKAMEVIKMISMNPEATRLVKDFLNNSNMQLYLRNKIKTVAKNNPAIIEDRWQGWTQHLGNGKFLVILPKTNNSAETVSYLIHEILHTKRGPNEFDVYLRQARFIASYYQIDPKTFEVLRRTVPKDFIGVRFRFTGSDEFGNPETEQSWPIIDKDAILKHTRIPAYQFPFVLVNDHQVDIKWEMLNLFHQYNNINNTNGNRK